MPNNNGLMGIILSTEGIETISFLGKTQKEREKALGLYINVRELLRELDRAIKGKSEKRQKNLGKRD